MTELEELNYALRAQYIGPAAPAGSILKVESLEKLYYSRWKRKDKWFWIPGGNPAHRNTVKRMYKIAKVKQKALVKRIDDGDWFRAAGNCACPVCKLPYSRHRAVKGHEWLNLLCNGWLVKL